MLLEFLEAFVEAIGSFLAYICFCEEASLLCIEVSEEQFENFVKFCVEQTLLTLFITLFYILRDGW
ncbi:ORF13 [White sturgeon adenovirus 1]|uniref:ORF13 n=1 Tax=White sturgeon adenovirus 1 TaxID=2580388 RepID=A0A4P8PIW3_9ADEN|nr:ORF13 [White sturgeon adenovirus 1]QCQ84189.1 ORF13 [White sturgeon adenovirus 1]